LENSINITLFYNIILEESRAGKKRVLGGERPQGEASALPVLAALVEFESLAYELHRRPLALLALPIELRVRHENHESAEKGMERIDDTIWRRGHVARWCLNQISD